jgi:hypothetical protein
MIIDLQNPDTYTGGSFFDQDDHPLYEILDAETGEVIADSIFYADDEAGFYRRYSHLEPATLSDFARDGIVTGPAVEEVRRPIRIAPRLERLCASLRADLASLGVSADDIPEPVLGALVLFQERLERLERRFWEAIAHPQVRVESVTTAERMGNPDGRYPTCMPRIGEADVCERCGGPVDPAINRPCPAVPREQRWGPSVESVTRAGQPWTRADLERFLPEVRVESVASPKAGPTFDPDAIKDYNLEGPEDYWGH